MSRTVQTVALIFMLAISGAVAGDTGQVLTTTAQVRSLTAAQAALKIPIRITGVVTVAEPCWDGRFFVQDSTGGVFVNNTNRPYPVPGDLVQVSGVSNVGGYTPDIILPQWKKLGKVPLPQAKPVSIKQLMSGAEDGDRVEVSGVVKSATAEETQLSLELESGGYRFQAMPPYSTNINPEFLVGTTVRIRGTAATSFDEHRHFLTAVIYMPQEPEIPDFIVDQIPGTMATNTVLATAAKILSLTASQAAKSIPVSITGVVTVAEPNWRGDFFVQDATGGAFVNSRLAQPSLGDVVRVTGFSHRGGFAPDINAVYWKKLGTAPLPIAVPISVDQFMSGAADGQRVELLAVVRSAQQSKIVKSRMRLELESGGYRFRAFPPFPSNLDPDSLVGATVRLRGTSAVSFNPSLQNMLTVVMFVPQESDFIVERLPNPAISDAPLVSLNRIAQYRRNNFSDPRIRVRGVVTCQRPGKDIFLHDRTGGLQVKSGETNFIAPGEIVEAIGFPGVESFLPVLEDATLIRTAESEKPIVPKMVSVQQLFDGFHHADLVSLQGTLLNRSLRSGAGNPGTNTNTGQENVLTLKSGSDFFTVIAPASEQFAALASIPIGSTIQVSGICLGQAGEDGTIQTVQIMPVNAGDIRILRHPGWWTPQRLFMALGILLVVSLVGVTWTVMIHRKNKILQLSIEEKIKAQNGLQKANDLLETRVHQRTRELKVEISARKETEIKCEAILSERKRLAQELHDTLLQGFTGIGLKLDAVANSLPSSLAATRQQMQKILEQSDEYLSEARRSVWQLRSPSLENPGVFSEALKKVSRRALQGTGIPLSFTTSGEPFKLSPDIEDNFLRICEEAVTNAVKHANPAGIEVMLEFLERELRLRVRDHGCGFDPKNPDGAKDGHFGLVGIQERARRLGGNFSLNSQPGRGTEILVTIARSPVF